MRAARKTNQIFSGKTNNPGVELVFGGILDALKNAPLAIAKLDLDKDLNISISLPFDESWASK